MSMQSPLTTAIPGSGIAPQLPPREINVRRRLTVALLMVLFIAFLIYCWIDVQGSISQFIHGVFGPNGLIRNVLPQSVPPTWSQIWPGVQAAATTLAIAVLSIVFGVFWSLAMLPFAARKNTPNRTGFRDPPAMPGGKA